MKKSTFSGTARLFRLYLRSKRAMVLLLILLPLLFSYAAAASNAALLQTPEQLAVYIKENQGNALLGDIDANTVAGVTVWRIRTSTAIISGILSISLVTALTRREEELGRTELLRAGAIGSKAPISAALLAAFAANLLGGIFMACGFVFAGFPLIGSVTAGLAVALCCCAFCGVAAITAQLAPGARAARGVAYGVLALFLFLQMIANSVKSAELLLWTPFGWCALAKPFAGELPIVLLFGIACAALLTFAAYRLYAGRDMHGGYLKERRARVNAPRNFKSAFALAWRLQRGTLLLWAAAYAVMGLILASLTPAIQRMLNDTAFLPELSARLGGAGNAFLAILAYILSQVLTAYCMLSVLRIREEETAFRAELILSGPVSRLRFALSHLIIAYAGSAVALLLFGLCMGDLAVLSRLPAVWLVASVSVLACGFAPRRAAAISYGVFGLFLLIEFLWEMRFINNTVFMISPFAWVYPGVGVLPLPLIVMLLLAVLLLSLGLFRFSRRDMTGE